MHSRLLTLLDAIPARRVAVIGDLIADEFNNGRVARVSREAPVLILQYDSTQILPGGAGNAANNVAALGGRTQNVGLTGKDEAGKRLHASLGHVNTRGLLSPKGYCTPVKTRILAGGVHTAKQQNVRIDRVVSTECDAKSRATFTRAAVKAAGAKIEGYYYCPHSTHAAVERYRTDCDCRKPKPGMILAAARDHSLDLSQSFVVGDRWRDIEMGLAAGTKGLLVETGYGRTEAARRPAHIPPVPVAANLIEAVSMVMNGYSEVR